MCCSSMMRRSTLVDPAAAPGVTTSSRVPAADGVIQRRARPRPNGCTLLAAGQFVECPLNAALAGAERQRQCRARPGFAIGEKREHCGVFFLDRPRQHDDVARRGAVPAQNRAWSRSPRPAARAVGAEPPDLDAAAARDGIHRHVLPRNARDQQRFARHIRWAMLRQCAGEGEQHGPRRQRQPWSSGSATTCRQASMTRAFEVSNASTSSSSSTRSLAACDQARRRRIEEPRMRCRPRRSAPGYAGERWRHCCASRKAARAVSPAGAASRCRRPPARERCARRAAAARDRAPPSLRSASSRRPISRRRR